MAAAASMESPSPDTLSKGSGRIMGSSPLFSPSSDKRFWSTLRNRVDSLLENQKHPLADQSLTTQMDNGEVDNRAKRLKEDSLLLLRGFDSVASSLSQLSNNLDNALQGARDLARPPTLSDIVHISLENAKRNDNDNPLREEEEAAQKDQDEKSADYKRGFKRKLDWQEGSDDTEQENGQISREFGKLNRAKNIAISMAKRAASLAREMKSIKSDLCFVQERCSLLEEENRRLRDGFAKGIPPEEDDLVRLQLEALLAEKSRLANDNANLTRENQCLRQLVEYHQLTSQQELSDDTYENVIRGMCLDFSSPPPPIQEEDGYVREEKDMVNDKAIQTPQTYRYGLATSLDEYHEEEQQQQ